MSELMINTEKEFVESIENSKGIVVAGITVERCQHCKTLAPLLEKKLQELPEKVTFFRVDYEKTGNICDKYITSIPTMVVFIDGKKVASKKVSGLGADEVMNFIKSSI